MTILWWLMKSLQRCVEAHLQCSDGTLCYRLGRLAEGYKPFIPFDVSAAENSYAGERSYKTGLPLSHKKNYNNIYNKNHYL